jgi:hypothetical protein
MTASSNIESPIVTRLMACKSNLTAASRCLGAALLVFAMLSAVVPQKKYSWNEMPRKEAQQLLANSPWSQTQVDTDTSEMFYSPTRQGAPSVGRQNAPTHTDQQSVNNNRADRGALNQAVTINYRISFLSARPIRQAFAKMILSTQTGRKDELAQSLQAFVERDFSSYVVIAISVDASDRRLLGPVMQEINSATTGALKNTTYLERQDGKRVFLIRYEAPIADGLGAKFIFPRLVDGEPFLTSKSGTVRFFAEFSDAFKINMRYKVAEMIYDQKLEY